MGGEAPVVAAPPSPLRIEGEFRRSAKQEVVQIARRFATASALVGEECGGLCPVQTHCVCCSSECDEVEQQSRPSLL